MGIVGRDYAAGEATVRAITHAGGHGTFLPADMSSLRQVAELATQVRERLGSVSVLVHSADVLRRQRMDSVDGIEVSVAVNYLSWFLLNSLLSADLRGGVRWSMQAVGLMLKEFTVTVTKDEKNVPEARRLRRELFSDELVVELLARAAERGVALTGEGGFVPEMIKSVLERGMDAELTSHLGSGDPVNAQADRGAQQTIDTGSAKPPCHDQIISCHGCGCMTCATCMRR